MTRLLCGVRGRLIQAHAQAQAHALQDLLDLVERLPAEVFRLQHLAFGLLHELANRPDVRVLQAVVRPDGQLELLDRLVEVLVADTAAGLIARGLALRLNALRSEERRVGKECRL